MKWYPDREMKCPLCDESNDSVKHLFFECSFAKIIWADLRLKSQLMDLSYEWDDVLLKMINLPCNNSIASVFRRLVVSASIYYIWNERNKRLFAGDKRDAKKVLKIIIDHIIMKLDSLKVNNSAQVVKVGKDWQVKMNVKIQEICIEKWK